MSNGINGALIAQSGKVCYNIDASIRDKAFRMVFIRLSEFYQVQYITLTKGCQESFSVSLYTPLSVCYNLRWYPSTDSFIMTEPHFYYTTKQAAGQSLSKENSPGHSPRLPFILPA